MKPTSIIQRLVILLVTLMSAIGANAAEAYACYTSSNTMLTFYYDNNRSTHTNTYSLNTGNVDPGWNTSDIKANLTKVVFDSSFAGARPKSTFSWFSGMANLESIEGMSYLNTSEVTDMRWMFYDCSKLTSLDLSHFNTSVVDYMARMFSGCSSLITLDLSSFNTSLVDDMSNMFYECRNLQTICVGSGWNVDGVLSSGGMFMRCTSLVGGQGTVYNYTHADKTYAHIDGGTSNPGYLTDINSLMPYAYYTPENTTLTFYYDGQRSSRSGTTYNLNTGDLPNWYYDDIISNVTKVVFDSSFADARPTSTYFWFCNMSNLESIEGLSNLNTSEVTNMSCMFISCEKITSFDLSRFNTSNVTKMNYMFAFCSKLESLDLSKFNTSKVTDMSGMFYGSTNLQTIYVGSGWSTAAATNSKNMFADCNYLVGGKGTTWNSSNPTDKTYAHIDSSSNPGYFTASNETMSYACYTPENTTLTFYCDKLRSSRPGTTYNLNTGSNVPRWENDDIRSNVTKVVFDSSFADVHPTTTYYWFVNMANLESIEGMNYLNTSEVTSMRSMFYGCSKLTSLDLSSFNTAKVTSMHSMFYGCSKLTSLVLSSFTTAKVTDMSEMFYGSKLTSLDLSSFNTAKVTDMSKMFYGSKLTSLDLSSFNTAKVTDMSEMFWDCTKLQIIYVGSGWSTAEVTNSSYMFDYCSRLVGGKGTSYDENHVDKTYAHIDGGTSNPGYFTDKNASVAYACYTPSNTTLTFYYDGQRSSRDGTTYNLNTGDLPIWYYDGKYNDVTDVVFDSSFAGAHPTTTYDWFYNMSNLESIDGLSNLNTSEVTNMRSMFSYCVKLTSLDLSGFNTANVTNMMQMFYGCTSLQTIYVGSGWSTAEVTNSFNSFAMFSDCTSLVGGKGTTYDENNINDATYAHIDGGPTDPGYFTERTTGIATGIENSQKDAVKGQSEEWYTLDGRKISGEPTKRGVYIQKGRAVVK